MSLINQVLQDLDARGGKYPDMQDTALNELQYAVAIKKDKRRNTLYHVTIGSLILTIVLLFIWYLTNTKNTFSEALVVQKLSVFDSAPKQQADTPVAVLPSLLALDTQAKIGSKDSLQTDVPRVATVNHVKKPIQSQVIPTIAQQHTPVISIEEFNRKATNAIAVASTLTIANTLNDTTNAATYATDAVVTSHSQAAQPQPAMHSKQVVLAHVGSQVKESAEATNHASKQGMLPIAVLPSADAPPIDQRQADQSPKIKNSKQPTIPNRGRGKAQRSDYPAMTHDATPKPVKSAHSEQLQKQLIRAQYFFQRGKILQSIAALKQILGYDASYYKARQLLVALLNKQGHYRSARIELEMGLKITPGNLSLIKQYVHFLVNNGELATAIAVLEKSLPETGNALELKSFLAALYQRNGQYGAAVQAYHRILLIQPDNSVWQMGYAISLEQSGRNGAAIAAYQQAILGNRLRPPLQDFVETKIQQLSKVLSIPTIPTKTLSSVKYTDALP